MDEIRRLYGVKASELKFGVTPGSHVAHMLTPEENGTELTFTDPEKDPAASSGYESVSQAEIYDNNGDKATAEHFRHLAVESEKLYNDPESGQAVKDLMCHVRDYITANGRASQQNALKVYMAKSQAYIKNLQEQIREIEHKPGDILSETGMSPADRAKLQRCRSTLTKLAAVHQPLTNELYGGLDLKEAGVNPAELSLEPIKEPQDVLLGRLSKWTKTNDALFPHMPSPNDIKQGVSLWDCYVMSGLQRLAASRPKQIKDSMRDNGDTVTVRFYQTKTLEDKSKVKEPVYITVNKTVNKTVGGHNVYASSCLWAQMLEKAYAEYNKEYVAPDLKKQAEEQAELVKAGNFETAYQKERAEQRLKNLQAEQKKAASGMGSMWVGYSSDFLDAFLPEHYVNANIGFMGIGDLDKRDKDGNYPNHPDYYLPEEMRFYEVMYKNINQRGEIVTAIPERYKLENQKKITTDVGLHPGHIYGVNKVFEKDGKYFVQVRDPYAMYSCKYENGILKSNDATISSTMNAGMDNMGTFNLELKDFMGHFSQFTGISAQFAEEVFDLNAREYSDPDQKLTPTEMKKEVPVYRQFLKDNKKKLMLPEKYGTPIFPDHLLAEDEKSILNELPKGVKLRSQVEKERLAKEQYQSPEEEIMADLQQEAKRRPEPKAPEQPSGEDKQVDPKDDPERKNHLDTIAEASEEEELGIRQNAPSPQDRQPQSEAERSQLLKDSETLQERNERTELQELTDMLKDPDRLKAFAQNIEKNTNDLKATDEFFVMTNTKQFNAMRDTLYALNKDLKNVTKGKKEPDYAALAQQIQKLQKQSDQYLDNKCAQINENFAAGKSPSDRAMLRMCTAVSIRSVCTLEKPLQPWASKKPQLMNVLKKDLDQQQALLAVGQKPSRNEKTREQVQQALNSLQEMNAKKPAQPSMKKAAAKEGP